MQQRKRAKLKLRDSCDGCSEAKTKCNKEKPVCSRCQVKGLTCCYGPSHRSGRRSAEASKAFERSRKSPARGLVPAPAYVDAPTSQVVSSSNDIGTTATLNSTSNTDFSFSIDAFDFPDIAFDGVVPGTTPFTYSPELLKMNLSASEYDVAAFMSSNPDASNNNDPKGNIDNSNSASNDSFTYDHRNDSIACDLNSMTYDPQWFNNPGVIFRNSFGSGLAMPPSSSYAPQMNLPDVSTSSSLQSGIYNHQASTLPNTNTDAILGTTSPKTSCACLTQALSLLAALHGNTDASSSSTCSPIISPQTPPYADNNNANTTTLHSLVGGGGGGTGAKSAATATIQECLTLNTSSLQQATKILNCECSSHNQQLIFFIAFIALKTMDRYTAAAQGADTIDRDSHGNGQCSSRALAQLVLGELHRVVRIVDTLSKRMREGPGRQDSSSSGSSSSQSGRGKAPEVGAGGPQGGAGGYDISASCFAQLEKDLRKHLKAVTNDTMAVLRREQE